MFQVQDFTFMSDFVRLLVQTCQVDDVPCQFGMYTFSL